MNNGPNDHRPSPSGAATEAGPLSKDGHERQALFDLCERAVQQRVFPGVVAYVERDRSLMYHEAHGNYASYCADTGSCAALIHQPLALDSVFDLASLTKVLATTILCAQLVEQQQWSMNQPLAENLLPRTPEATLAQILAHCGGFVAHRPFYRDYSWPSAQSRQALVEAVQKQSLGYAIGTDSVYSDLGFIVLGAALEAHYGQRLDEIFLQQIARPLGLDQDPERWVGFLAVDSENQALPAQVAERIVPSELYSPALHENHANKATPDYFELRERCAGPAKWARGEVHDDNCFCMLGVAGHAGLFGTALGVVEIARAWMDSERLGIKTENRDLFMHTRPRSESSRRLGWDGKSANGILKDSSISEEVVGHLGFTGTSLWIDPRGGGVEGGDAIYVVLSHRVHPTRDDASAMREFRRDFHRLAPQLKNPSWGTARNW